METERFSSMGGIPKLFDAQGNCLAAPEVCNQPRFTAPNGVYTTFFYTTYIGYTFPMFFGTSAAAPHAAAVAALLLQANSTLTPGEIYSALEKTAVDMKNQLLWTAMGYNVGSGYGLIDALAAVKYVKGKSGKPPTARPSKLTSTTPKLSKSKKLGPTARPNTLRPTLR